MHFCGEFIGVYVVYFFSRYFFLSGHMNCTILNCGGLVTLWLEIRSVLFFLRLQY